MKVLGITGSLRPQSNTMAYMQRCLAVLEEHGIEPELISLRGKTIKPCLGCYACVKDRRCAQDDDDFAEILAKMEAAQGIVLGSPVYLSSVVPQMMCLLSRATFVAHWNGKFLAGKVGGPITVARRAGHNMAFSQLLLWFFINGITVPGSTYWTVGMAGAGGAHDALEDSEGLTHVSNFAANLAGVMAKIFA
ncbi:MAG: flavodoxin family protein [Pseudomonadota bacterium]